MLRLGDWNCWQLAGPDWTIIYVGRRLERNKVAELFFSAEVEEFTLARVRLWAIQKQIRVWLESGVDLVVCETSRIRLPVPQAPVTFAVPTLVNQVLDISGSLESLLKGRRMESIRRSIKALGKAGYTYRCSQSKDDYDFFYHRMYLPFVRARHGDAAIVAPFDQHWKHWFEDAKGVLVIIEKDGQPYAASICYLSDGTCYCIDQGILDADPDLIRKGLIAYNYWGPILWAKEQGAIRLNMGASSSWVTNRVFEYKRRWGSRVVRHRRHYNYWTFCADRLPKPLAERINEIGFICETEGRLCGLSIKGDSTTLTPREANQLTEATKRNGLQAAAVLSRPPNAQNLAKAKNLAQVIGAPPNDGSSAYARGYR